MLSEDLEPWLIEINSSPSMARTTRVTAELVDCVLEDTVKGIQTQRHWRHGNGERRTIAPPVNFAL